MTRESALSRLAEFLPHAAGYAAMRNHDFGPGRHEHVSGLSPYLRHRLILEQEVARVVLARHAYPRVEIFLQEVAWRTYWKGWLEMRPSVWRRYVEDVATMEPATACVEATEGRTGIGCFDAWCRELVETGYLHNHARMWFASIWIFTLGLPWQLGADFFYRHLMDGDPASNTLSWRWVAGLHTRGKHYLARAENMARYTGGRWNPLGQLVEEAKPLVEGETHERQPLAWPVWHEPEGRVGHLMLADDLGPPPCDVVATVGWHPLFADDFPPVVSPLVHEARSRAVDDAVRRAQGERLTGEFSAVVSGWVKRCRLDTVVMAYPTVGPWRDLLDEHESVWPLRIFVREWDRTLWPHASAGFFRLREKLPGFFRSMGSGTGNM